MNKGYQFKPFENEKISHTQLVQYAGATGDFNPIHTVVSYAQEAGFTDVIAHGMLIMGFIGRAIGQWTSVDNLTNFSVRFKAITKPGEKIIVKGSVIEEKEHTWICEATAANEEGEVKAIGSFEVKK